MLSDELQAGTSARSLALLPLPASAATLESITSTAAPPATWPTLAIVGETDEVKLETRWKDRGGEPRIVEVSHLSRVERALPEDAEGEGEYGGGSAAEDSETAA